MSKEVGGEQALNVGSIDKPALLNFTTETLRREKFVGAKSVSSSRGLLLMNTPKRHYTQVYWDTGRTHNINGNKLLIFSLIESLGKSKNSKGGWVQIDYERMADCYNITPRCAKGCIDRLESEGKIEKRQGKGVHANSYRVVARSAKNSLLEEGTFDKNFTTSCEDNSLEQCKNCTTSGENISHIKHINTFSKEFKDTNNSSEERVNDDFEIVREK